MNRRARPGGEPGANGEWYEGGQFIATTDRPKRSQKPKKADPSKLYLVEPGIMKPAPEDGYKAIFQAYREHFEEVDGKFMVRKPLNADYFGDVREITRMAKGYGEGYRWFKFSADKRTLKMITDYA